MEYRYPGDTILFESAVYDNDGTAVTTATVTLSVKDGVGSYVLLNVNAPHLALGSYRVNGSTAGWGLGPITETWVSKFSSGTLTKVSNNQTRLISTALEPSYIFAAELQSYYENIGDYFDGGEEALVTDACNEIKAKLVSMGQKMPIQPKPDGFYDQPLRDLNAYAAIARIVSRRQSGYGRDDDKPWFRHFNDLAGSIYKKIENKTYNFDRDYDVSEAGIGVTTKTVGSSLAQLETNWRGGVGTGFQDYTFERDWFVQVTGTGTAGEVNEGTFKWSNDGGLNYATAYQTSYDWSHLKDGVYVRFHRGTGTSGTINILATGDTWTWKTFPRNQSVGGRTTARSY